MQPSPLPLSVLFSALHSQTMATGSWGREILSHTVKGWNEETIQNSQLNETKEISKYGGGFGGEASFVSTAALTLGRTRSHLGIQAPAN